MKEHRVSRSNIFPGSGHRAQGLDRTEYVYHSKLQPWLAIWGTFWTCLLILINGFQVFFTWNTSDFFTAYINIPFFFILWAGWRIYKRTRFWRAHEMDFVTVCGGLWIRYNLADV